MNMLRTVVMAGTLSFAAMAGSAIADGYTIDDVKRAVAQYPEIRYAMMGDVVFLHGTTDNLPELGNIVSKLMKIEGVKEVRTNIFSK